MKKNVWIFNHYATNMFFDKAGRHYWFAKNLIKSGYKATVFCASTNHFSNNHFDIKEGYYISKNVNGIPFTFIKTNDYKGNGKNRIINMISFYRNLFPSTKKFADINGKPDVILASSVHPLTLVAGIKIAKKFGVPCICEIRDLWPESLVAYGSLNRNSIIAKILYIGEKWIYKKADKLIFTMEGGKDYIIDQGWDKDSGGKIDISKVEHINNGVDILKFNFDKENFNFSDKDLDNSKVFKVVYTGSIRKVNDLDYLLNIAKELDKKKRKDILIIVYGDGDDYSRLKIRIKEENIKSIIFKGKVSKERIPYILSKADLNIIHFKDNSIKKYGASLNKMFEYFASGKPVLSDSEFGYDLIKRYNCGVVIDRGSPTDIAYEIINIKMLPNAAYVNFCDNSLNAAREFDFKKLTNKLILIIESFGGNTIE